MRIAVDDQIFSMHRKGGISRYFTELLKQFSTNSEIAVTTPFRFIVNDHLHEAFPGRYVHIPKPRRLPARPLIELLNLVQTKSHGRVDLVHHTYYNAGRLSLFPGARRVCTIHDMIPEMFPDLFPLGNPHREKLRYVSECDAILCVSETTKKDLERIYGPYDKPVLVTYLGVDPTFYAPAVGRPALNYPYVLYVGARKGYKNFNLLARAFARVNSDALDLHLVCIGGGGFTSQETSVFDDLGISRNVHRFQPSDAELPQYYSHAKMLCFPSRYEGFGLPLVEAFAAGCPTIIADTPCLVEIADGASAIVDPDDDEGLAEVILRLSRDSTFAETLISAGRGRSQQFTWQSTARQSVAAYRRILADS